MLNQIVLVGRVTEDVKLKELEDGKKECNIILSVSRNIKNPEGSYDTDFITCKLLGSVAESTAEYCHKGDIVGIKGRVQSNIVEDKENRNKKIDISIIADRVTFLTSKSKDKEELER